jgi:hypothetical protein
VIILESLAVFFDVIGRYNLSKTLMVSGFINVIIGLEFLWTARLLHEMFLVVSRYYGKSEKLSYSDLEKVADKVPATYYLLLLLGWFVLFARNFYSFRLLTDPFTRMLVEEHKIGNHSFTITNMLY